METTIEEPKPAPTAGAFGAMPAGGTTGARPAPRPASSGSSFLDDWLAKRQMPVQPTGMPQQAYGQPRPQAVPTSQPSALPAYPPSQQPAPSYAPQAAPTSPSFDTAPSPAPGLTTSAPYPAPVSQPSSLPAAAQTAPQTIVPVQSSPAGTNTDGVINLSQQVDPTHPGTTIQL